MIEQAPQSNPNQEAFHAQQQAHLDAYSMVRAGSMLRHFEPNGNYQSRRNEDVRVVEAGDPHKNVQSMRDPFKNEMTRFYTSEGQGVETYSATARTEIGDTDVKAHTSASRYGNGEHAATASIERRGANGEVRTSTFKNPEYVKKAGDIITRMAERELRKSAETKLDSAA